MIDTALLAALNHLLQGAEWARTRLMVHAGRHACFDMPPFRFGFVITDTGLCEPQDGQASPDVTIHLPADTPFLLLQGLDRVMAGARVSGNAEFATELSFVFRNLRWDAEEDLSRLVGDIAATRIVEGGRRFAGWQKDAATRFGENVVEYLVHESPLLVGNAEFTEFREAVVRQNAALTALEKRVRMLG